MTTLINKYEQATGNLIHSAVYTTNARKALINYVMQEVNCNFNTWKYPEDIEGIKESTIKQSVLYFETENYIIQAIPQ